jgi:hypothetical protein
VLSMMNMKRLGFSAVILLFAMLAALVNPAPAQAADVAFSLIGTPSISGTNQVGMTLSATTGSWNPTPTTFSYQWRRDGMDINYATNSTYTLTGDDYQRSISVRVTGSRTGNITAAGTSGSMYISYKGDFLNTPNLSINGTLMVGEYLYAVPGNWPNDVNKTYQWQANYVNIPNAISDTYQLQPTDKNKTITLKMTVTRFGYNDSVKTFTALETVKPATPKLLWQYNYSVMTGKNTFKATATHSFGSNDAITTWCIKKDGVALTLPLSTKGVYFTDTSNRLLTAYSAGGGCYSSYSDDLINIGLRIDLTDWTVGAHALEATVKDTSGIISLPMAMTVTVAKTAPTVVGNFTSLANPIKDAFTVSASTTTHSTEAPIKRWCMTIDGSNLNHFDSAEFSNSTGAASGRGTLMESQGCIYSSDASAILTQGNVVIDSKQFANGVHELGIKVMSQDSEGTFWWSDVIKTSFKIKNPYVPNVNWSSATNKVAAKGKANSIAGNITANIPGSPSKVTLSAQNASGGWDVFFTGNNSNNFATAAKFTKNTSVQIEIFDEDSLSVLTDEVLVRVAPVVALAKPKIVLTGSTISDKITKTVTVTATSAGLNANCSAKWSGGSSKFAMKVGKGSFTFRPRGSGSVSVVCNAAEMAPSAAAVAKY